MGDMQTHQRMVVVSVLYPNLTADIEALKAGQHAHFLPTPLQDITLLL